MILNLADFVIKDFVYKQNPDTSYVINNGDFLLEDRNAIVDTILDILKNIYTGIVQKNKISPGRIECNVYLLDQALTRYSRDVFGELRLNAKVAYLGKVGALTGNQQEQLARFSDYGLKIDSRSPYFHRHVGNLLYWLSVLKPFAIYTDGDGLENGLGVAFEFHNEYISYLLVLSMLKVFNSTIDIHKRKDRFYDFLYDLHFRSLSRSSLDFFLNAHVKVIKK
jgi:hypothetical protein